MRKELKIEHIICIKYDPTCFADYPNCVWCAKFKGYYIDGISMDNFAAYNFGFGKTEIECIKSLFKRINRNGIKPEDIKAYKSKEKIKC